MKFLVMIIWSAICIAIALIVPTIGWWIFHAVSPVTEIGRILLLLGMLFFGGGISFFVGMLAFALWVSGIGALAK